MDYKCSHDETLERAMKFVDNMKQTHPGISNLYVFTSVDKNGNIVDEKYGMNLMTNNGFQKMFADNNITSFDGDSLNLYVGTGGSTAVPDKTDTTIFNVAFNGTAATKTGTGTSKTKEYNYPIYFSPSETPGHGIITLISKFMKVYYPANITGYAGMTIRLDEYGLGLAYNNIFTHSRIYDQNGTPTYMNKEDDHELWITVYMCLSFLEEVILDGWNYNRFIAITQNNIMYSRMGWNSKCYIYKRYNKRVSPGAIVEQHIDTSSADRYKLSMKAPEWTMYDGTSDMQGYFDGFMLSTDGFLMVEPQFLPEPENVTYTNLWSNDPTTYTGFADKFGMVPATTDNYSKEQYPQLTSLTNAKAYLYDWKTHDWTCEIDVYNPDAKWYDETPSQKTVALPIYYYNAGTMKTGYLYQNIRPDDPILSVTSGAITLYATNKYWSPSASNDNTDPDAGWVWIRDYSNIPENCRSARYWISNTDSDSIKFVRASDCFKLLEKGTNVTGYVSYEEGEFPMVNSAAEQCDNYEYGWFKRRDVVYVPAQHRTFNNIGPSTSETMTYGKWMIIFGNSSNSSITIADMSATASSGILNPTTLVLNFTASNINTLTDTYRTESGTGYICIQSISTQEAIILDLTGSSVVQILKPWKMSCCIWGTNKAAYITTTSGDDFVYIRNLVNDTQDGNPIPFPSGTTSIPMLFGHTGYVWMAGPSLGAVADISTGVTQAASVSAVYDSTNLYAVKMTCVDEVFIIYRYNNITISDAIYIQLTDPTSGSVMTDFNRSNDRRGSYISIFLRYVNKYQANGVDHAGLALVIVRSWTNTSTQPNGADNNLYDFGQYLTRSPKSIDGIAQLSHATNNNMTGYIMYGESIIYRMRTKIPIANLMPIKLLGKTRTITATNNIKHMSDKSWLISFNNDPLWNGKPPGRPAATTNGDGEITTWTP